MSSEHERGNAPLRLEWYPESTEGQIDGSPANRSIDWNAFSDNIISAWSWEPDANTQRQDAAGETFAQGFFNGAETHDIEFEYDLQQWFVDGSDNTLDPHGDFLRASSDNALRTTHTILSRSEYDSGGINNGYRTYTVAKGCHPDSSTIPYETEDGGPITVTPSWQAEKVRRYTIRQPNDETLNLKSTDSNDTNLDVEVEGDGGSPKETVSLDGVDATNTVPTNDSYVSLDAVELHSEAQGDIQVLDGTGQPLARIQGKNSYPANEGDLGVPALDSGSHASALGGDYISFLDDDINLSSFLPAEPLLTSSEVELELVSGALEVDTGLDDNTQSGATARRNIHSENFDPVR